MNFESRALNLAWLRAAIYREISLDMPSWLLQSFLQYDLA
jgi:hypothetical protein